MSTLSTLRMYELNELYYKTMENAIDSETGEILDEVLFAKLNEIEEAKEVKLLNLACYFKEIEAETLSLKIQEDKLRSRRQSLEKQAERLEKWIHDNMEVGAKLSDERASLSWRKSEIVEVKLLERDLVEKLGAENVRIEVRHVPDKQSLKDAIKHGRVFEGVALISKMNLQIK
ncbi:siphovirus Gp157 family protein [Leptospira santarosai]|uniref:siphovirus Gp157 family protein n=1 Tax=Leptospira santarosai TaxID=28183 RepID=UPI0024AFD09D|nr:siphovirus Gp157 family protein [Leptospira santarosai]MDI7219372.1 siphovirus Gp157 family protein [Leptospira santarosai]